MGCWDGGASQEKNISLFCLFFCAQAGSRQTGTRAGRRRRLWLPGWQEVKASVSGFKPQTITGLKTLSALSSPVQRSVTPTHKTIRGLRGLAKVVGRKWSQNQGDSELQERQGRCDRFDLMPKSAVSCQISLIYSLIPEAFLSTIL